MSKRPKKPGKNKPSDMDLWKSVAETVTPIKPSNRHMKVATPALKTQVSQTPKPAKAKTPAIPTPSPAIKHKPVKPPALSGFDRRTTQKLMRGNVEIDARIDLHGMTQLAARETLKSFLARAHQGGLRLVLVITGKGQSSFGHHTLHSRDHISTPERTGILRNALADWLNDEDFRRFVIGYQPAHPKHGGGGAFYVRLRRASNHGAGRS